MTTWLYQVTEAELPLNRYRRLIWESERWAWPVRSGGEPTEGDVLVFFYAQIKAVEAGFYGWAVVESVEDGRLVFRPAAPSDHLKMDPWSNDAAIDLAKRIRGKVFQKTLFEVKTPELERELRDGISRWISRH